MVWHDMQWYSYSLPFLLLNDMQGYVLHSHTLPFLLMPWYARICLHSHTLPFLLMQTFWMDTHCMDPYWWDTCWTDTYWWDMYWWDTFAIPADAHLLNGYALNGYASHGYVLVGYVLKEKVLVGYVLVGYVCKTDANLLNGYALNGYVLVGYVLKGYVLVGYVLVGYVLNGYVWDMCGVMDMSGICVVWDTPTIFWRTLRRNVFREKYLSCHHLVTDLLLVVFEDFDPRTLARSRIRDHRYRQVTHPKTSMVSLVVLPRHSNSMHHVDVLHAASGSIARSALPGERLGTWKWCCSNMEMTQVMKIEKIDWTISVLNKIRGF